MRSVSMLQHVSQSVLVSDDGLLHVADVPYVSHDKSMGFPMAVIVKQATRTRIKRRCQ